ncbi:hypothetical protein GCM10022393_42900 [Aquimarina addita]|uniref:Dihydrolipoamide dehydrogenase n=1 Tax=Aquimarina addita TaxID=870485 RepID=A0ABP6UVJ5_9FLAO
MKNIIALLCFSLVLFTSCEGDQGPPGESGGIFLAETFEVSGLNFNAGNDFTNRVSLDPNIFNDDVILVYRLLEVDNGLDVWEPLPSAPVYFFDDVTNEIIGDLIYRFNFTVGDIDITLDTNVIDLVGPEYTNNQIFRIIVVPSEQANTLDIDFADFNAVQSALNLEF